MAKRFQVWNKLTVFFFFQSYYFYCYLLSPYNFVLGFRFLTTYLSVTVVDTVRIIIYLLFYHNFYYIKPYLSLSLTYKSAQGGNDIRENISAFVMYKGNSIRKYTYILPVWRHSCTYNMTKHKNINVMLIIRAYEMLYEFLENPKQFVSFRILSNRVYRRRLPHSGSYCVNASLVWKAKGWTPPSLWI